MNALALFVLLISLQIVFIQCKKSSSIKYCSENLNIKCPFDDLNVEEIENIKNVIRNAKFPSTIQLAIVKTQEPKKSVWNHNGGIGINTGNRMAFVALFNLETNIITEIVIDLIKSVIVSRVDLPKGITPIIQQAEFQEAEKIVRADPRWQEAIKLRGLTPSDVTVDPLTQGPQTTTKKENWPNKRLLITLTHYNQSVFNYWSPIEGLQVTVDLITQNVVEFTDITEVTLPSPVILEETESSKHPEAQQQQLPIKPLQISQPDGSSIKIIGQEIQWYKWKLRYSMNPVQGLQFYHIRYNTDCKDRLIIYKLSLSEMFIPYGVPGKEWEWRDAYDMGEYGIGKYANSLSIGLDLPENALLVDCIFAGEFLNESVKKIPNCIGIYERDIGILYKKTDWVTGKNEGIRGRGLVATFMTSIGNYDYTFDYIFGMDGNIKIQSRLTGILFLRGVNATDSRESCTFTGTEYSCSDLVWDHLVAPAHQHYFNYRIDFDVDGIHNTAAEVDVTADLSINENGRNFSPKKLFLTNETARPHSPQTHRTWRVINTNSRNKHGSPRAYTLKPGILTFPFYKNEHPKFAKFVKYPFWVSKYNDNEQRPAGNYPRSTPTSKLNGVESFIKDNASIENTDLVVWYTFGVMHVPRAEEFPLMPVSIAGFELVSTNFQSQNPAMPLKETCK